MAVVAGDYAVLTLIDGQLIDFGVTAAICAGSSVAAGLIAYAGRRRRKAVARGRAAVWERRDQQAAPPTNSARYAEARAKNQVTHPDSLTGSARAYAGNARRHSTQSRHDEPRPVSAPVLMGEQPERVRRSTASPALASREFGWGRGAPDDPGVEVLT